jgi:hypothetical protein
MCTNPEEMSVSGQRSELYDSMWVMLLLIKSCVKAKVGRLLE